MFGQGAHIVLGTFDVTAGFGIAPFGQGGHGFNGDFLGKGQLAGALEHQAVQLIAVFFEFELVAHPGFDQGGLEGLDDVVHGAQVQAVGLVARVVLRSDEQNGDAGCGRIFLKATAHLVTVHAGHDHVQQNDIGRVGAVSQTQAGKPVLGHYQGKFVLEGFNQNPDVFRGVVHDEHPVVGVGFHAVSRRCFPFHAVIRIGSWSACIYIMKGKSDASGSADRVYASLRIIFVVFVMT